MSNNQYYELPELISDEIIECVKKLSPAQLRDGTVPFGIERNGCMNAGPLPLGDGKLMVGTVCTVDAGDGDNLPVHVAIYRGKPGYVLVVAGRGYTERAYMGDLMGGATAVIGFSGTVIDGYARDKTDLATLDIPIYAKDFIQRSPDKEDLGETNTVVTYAGVKVTLGDLAVGDYGGTTVIPRRCIEEALTAAEKREDHELKRRDAIANYRKCREEGRKLPNLTSVQVTEMLQGKS